MAKYNSSFVIQFNVSVKESEYAQLSGIEIVPTYKITFSMLVCWVDCISIWIYNNWKLIMIKDLLFFFSIVLFSFVIAVDYFQARYPGTTVVFDMSMVYIVTAFFAVLLNNILVETLSLGTRITFGKYLSFQQYVIPNKMKKIITVPHSWRRFSFFKRII